MKIQIDDPEFLRRHAVYGIANELRSLRRAEDQAIQATPPPMGQRTTLTAAMVVEWAARSDHYVMTNALPYLRQGRFDWAAFKLTCHHLVVDTDTDRFCTAYALRELQYDASRWKEMAANTRHTSLLYKVSRFMAMVCHDQTLAPA